MRFIKVWYVKNENNLVLKWGSLGDTLFKEELEYLLTHHLKCDLVKYVDREEWDAIEKSDWVIVDKRFRQIVTEEYLGEWDEIYEL